MLDSSLVKAFWILEDGLKEITLTLFQYFQDPNSQTKFTQNAHQIQMKIFLMFLFIFISSYLLFQFFSFAMDMK